MITEEGISAILRAFTSDDKSGYRIEKLVLGNMVLGDGDDPIFEPLHVHELQAGQIIVINHKTLRVNIVIDSDDILTGYDVLEYTNMRLICVNGETFAWQGFTPRTLGAGLRATVNWEISLVDLVGDMVDKSHVHSSKSTLDKLGQSEDGIPTYDGSKLNIPKWRGDVW